MGDRIGYGGPPNTFFGFFGDGLVYLPSDEIAYTFTNWQTSTGIGGVKATKRNHWYMLTATFDGNTLKTYLDGTPAQSKSYKLQSF